MSCHSGAVALRDALRAPQGDGSTSSRQLALAAGPHPLVRLELCHAEQVAEDLKAMVLCKLDQFGNGFRDEGHGLVRAALPVAFIR